MDRVVVISLFNFDGDTILNFLGSAKITNLCIVVLSQKDVQGFDITVKYSFLIMQIMNSKTDLDEHFPNYILVKYNSLFMRVRCYLFYYMSLQISPRTVLKNDIYAKVSVNK